jgi:hypothetical protein
MLPKRMRRSYSFSFEKGENVSFSHFASNRKNLIEFIKLNLFVFVRDGGNVNIFAFRFIPEKNGQFVLLRYDKCST